MMEKYKILLDTDIGDDIDDALALALALEMPEMELVGVTTVFQNTEKRARIARKMLSLWGRDVPVYAGIALGEKPVCLTRRHPVSTPRNWTVRNMRPATYRRRMREWARWIFSSGPQSSSDQS